MKKHLIQFDFDAVVTVECYCGLRILKGDERLIAPFDLTPENEREVCKKCLRAYAPDMYPKEFTDTF